MPFRLALRAAHHHHLPSRRKRVHQKRSGNRLFPRSADTIYAIPPPLSPSSLFSFQYSLCAGPTSRPHRPRR